jgi:hypothetical protein
MERHQLTDAARQFLIDAIGSLERLDILLLMQHHAERWWTSLALATELRIPAEQVEAGLHALGRHNLIGVRLAEDVVYRYDPGTPLLRQLVDDIVNAHYADRHCVAAIVSSHAAGSARLFADAFRLRKGSTDDG